MSDQSQHDANQPTPEDRPRGEPWADGAPPSQVKPDAAAQPADSGAEVVTVEMLQGELDDLRSRLLRVSADYQNFARRARQNADEAREQAVMELAKAMVTVLDHFDLALQVDLDKASVPSVLEGMRIVREELLRSLGRFGIERLEVSRGDEFVPGRHEAVMQQAAEGVPSQHVAQQLQPGYVMGDKTLRPAKVAVAP